MRIGILTIISLILFEQSHSQDSKISEIERTVQLNKKMQAIPTFSVNGDVFEEGYSYTLIYISDSTNGQLSEVRYWRTNPFQQIRFYYANGSLLKADVSFADSSHVLFYFSDDKPLSNKVIKNINAEGLLTKAKEFLATYKKKR